MIPAVPGNTQWRPLPPVSASNIPHTSHPDQASLQAHNYRYLKGGTCVYNNDLQRMNCLVKQSVTATTPAAVV